MASVTFLTDNGGDGSTVTDDNNPTTGLDDGGHVYRFVPALAQTVIQASTAVMKASAAKASAEQADAAKVLAQAAQAGAIAISLNVPTGLPVIRPELLLDFANSKQLSPRLNFSRAGTAAETNAAGLVKTVAANKARLDHEPLSGVCLGLLVEGSRANLALYSAQIDNPYWYATSMLAFGSGSVANAAVAPDGTVSADEIVESTGGGGHQISGVVTYAEGGVYTASAYVKPASGTRRAELTMFVTAGGYAICVFDLQTGAALTPTYSGAYPFSAGQAHITALNDGWYRLSLTATANTTAGTGRVLLRLNNGSTNSYNGDGASGLYLWGVQLELGAFATSYIATTSAAVTRVADGCDLSGSNFSGLYRQDAFSLVVAFRGNASGVRLIFSVDDGTASNRIYLQSIDGVLALNVTVGGVDQASLSLGTLVNDTAYTVAATWKLNDFAACLNGGAAVTDNAGTVPAVTQLHIGADHAGTNNLGKAIAKIAGYPQRLTNTQLQALSS